MAPLLACLLPTLAAAAPVVQNPSFEADRYTAWPGTAAANGKAITGWTYTGNAGVNPLWKDPQAQKGPDSPFHDNGAVPEGRQLAFIQGPGRLSQVVSGFERGGRYMVFLRENTRLQRQGTQWPRVQVTLGGELVVSAHDVTPIAKKDAFDVPFYRVESAVFAAPRDGEFELVIETVQESRTTTILLDAVGIAQIIEDAQP
ncbi:MAG: hypothetical protein FJX74_00210 [Armatimonadetes bacterium]|nr:hypothetical protein [Armatimonadota bacterium]